MADHRLVEALEDLARMLRSGANVVSSGPVFLQYPYAVVDESMITPLQEAATRRRRLPLRQRRRSRLRQRRAAAGSDRGERAHRRAPGVRDPQLQHLQPADGDLRHHGVRPAPGRRPDDPPARRAHHGLGQRGAPAGRRPRRRARLGRGVVRAGARPPRPSRSTRAPSRRAPPAALHFEVRGIRDGRAVIVLEHVTRLRDDLAPDWPQPAGQGCYRVEITGEPNYTLDLQLVGSDGDHNTAGLKATAMRLVNAIPAVVDGAAGAAHRARPPPGHRARPGLPTLGADARAAVSRGRRPATATARGPTGDGTTDVRVRRTVGSKSMSRSPHANDHDDAARRDGRRAASSAGPCAPSAVTTRSPSSG